MFPSISLDGMMDEYGISCHIKYFKILAKSLGDEIQFMQS
jgi:hypothetical protein